MKCGTVRTALEGMYYYRCMVPSPGANLGPVTERSGATFQPVENWMWLCLKFHRIGTDDADSDDADACSMPQNQDGSKESKPMTASGSKRDANANMKSLRQCHRLSRHWKLQLFNVAGEYTRGLDAVFSSSVHSLK